MTTPVTPADVHAAAARLAGLAHRTPVLTSHQLDALAGARVHLKCENFQRIGAFKFRGAANAVFALPADAAARGVLTHSSGNHGQALALAAKLRGIPATVVMPEDSSAVKLAAVRGYGARVVLCEPTTAAREAAAARVQEETGATLVHPYDDPFVIAGQGTACLELADEVPDLDVVMTPVGGGGLLSGTLLAASAALPRARVYGAEPAAADDAARSVRAGTLQTVERPRTIADGLRSASLGKLTFPLIKERVTDVLTVDEAEIVAAMRFVWERMKIVIEPSSAVAVAALLRYRDVFAGHRVGIVISGGNVDLGQLPWR